MRTLPVRDHLGPSYHLRILLGEMAQGIQVQWLRSQYGGKYLRLRRNTRGKFSPEFAQVQPVVDPFHESPKFICRDLTLFKNALGLSGHRLDDADPEWFASEQPDELSGIIGGREHR